MINYDNLNLRNFTEMFLTLCCFEETYPFGPVPSKTLLMSFFLENNLWNILFLHFY